MNVLYINSNNLCLSIVKKDLKIWSNTSIAAHIIIYTYRVISSIRNGNNSKHTRGKGIWNGSANARARFVTKILSYETRCAILSHFTKHKHRVIIGGKSNSFFSFILAVSLGTSVCAKIWQIAKIASNNFYFCPNNFFFAMRPNEID